MNETPKTEAPKDWEAIACKLADRLLFAIKNLKAAGSGMVLDRSSDDWRMQPWRDYLIEGIELVYTVDREVIATYGLPKAKRIKAQQEIAAKREAERLANFKPDMPKEKCCRNCRYWEAGATLHGRCDYFKSLSVPLGVDNQVTAASDGATCKVYAEK